MNIIKRFILLTTIAFVALSATAQSNGCNSSYSRFGLGLLNDQSQGFNRSMGGVAQGFRPSTQVNMLNPASYSAIDSLTFIFDAGMRLQVGRLTGNGSSINALNTKMEYVNAGFRLTKGLGMSIGFVPYSTIGYNFTESSHIGKTYTTGESITSKTTYYGNGGLHELYIGAGWNPFAKLSIGANIGYLWGDYDHSLAQNFYEGSTTSSVYSAQNEVWKSDMRTYKLDIGAQYLIAISKKETLTLGATMSVGHTIGSSVELIRYTSQGDTISNTTKDAFQMPYTVSAGASWQHGEGLTIGADYALERWKGCRVPISQATATSNEIIISTDQYSNKHHVALGAEYIQHPQPGGKYGQHIHYRLGVSYTTPYIKVNGHDGPREYSLNAGVALPITTSARSLINVSVQWLRRSPTVSHQITENYFMVHLGVTFNEQWFMKWRFQ